MKSKIDLEAFNILYYKEDYSVKSIARHFGCHVSAIGSFRKRNNLPKRPRSQNWLNRVISGHKGQTPWNKGGINPKIQGANNPNWKGGSYINAQGYRRIRIAPNDYRLEHRVVVERSLGRNLDTQEVVHHINGDKLDNRIVNLEIHSKSSHARLHFPTGSKFGIHNQL